MPSLILLISSRLGARAVVVVEVVWVVSGVGVDWLDPLDSEWMEFSVLLSWVFLRLPGWEVGWDFSMT